MVQMGDLLDRGDEERRCMDRLFDLKRQSAEHGGAVHVLLGNHEVMNVDWDFDYIGLGGFDGWETLMEPHARPVSLFKNALSKVMEGWSSAVVHPLLRERAKAFTIGTGFAALMLSEMPLVIQIGDTVFVHGGLEMKHVNMGLHRINVEINEWLRGLSPRPRIMDEEDSPVWNRIFSAPADRALPERRARQLEQVLRKMGARRMVVGHTPQAGGINCFITSAGYEVWRTDTGMSRWVRNGPLEFLEISADGSSQVCTRTGVVPGVVRKIEEGAVPIPRKKANSGAGERGFMKGLARV